MNDELTVRAEELSAHAMTVDAISETVAGVKQVAVPDLAAYGRLCALVPTTLGELQHALTDAVVSAGDSLADTANRLWETAQAYEFTERRRAEAFDDVHR
ncbi:MAG: type VII secretion target [Actinoplanes sp.]